MCLDLAVTGSKDGTVNVHSIKVIISGMEGGDIRLFITLVSKVSIQILGTFIEFLLGRFVKFQPLIAIYRMGNFMYYHWG